MHAWFADWVFPLSLQGAPWLMMLAIIAGTFVHEDIATVATGMLAAGGTIQVNVALPALYIGIIAGDIGLYCVGRLIRRNDRARRLSAIHGLIGLRAWLDKRLIAGVFMVRFLPGLRVAAYTTYGFFAMPFWRFAISAIVAASIWTTGLFYLSYEFGNLTANLLGVLRWPAIFATAVVPLIVIQRITARRLGAKDRDEQRPT